MSIVGVVAVGVLVDILLDDKDLGKYIKGIFGIIVVLVILAPLPKIFKNNKKIHFETKFGNVEMDKHAYWAILENSIEYQEDELTTRLRNAEQIVKAVKIKMDNQSMRYVAVDIYFESGMIDQRKTQEIVREKLGKYIEINFVEDR